MFEVSSFTSLSDLKNIHFQFLISDCAMFQISIQEVTLPRKKLKGGGQRNPVPVPSDEEASEEGQDQEQGLDEEDEGLGEEGGGEEESG